MKSADDLLFANQVVAVFLVVLLHLNQGGLKHVTITLKLHDVGLLLVGLLLEPVEVTEEVVHVALGIFFLLLCFELLSVEALLVVLKLHILTEDLTLLAVVLIHFHVEHIKGLLPLTVLLAKLMLHALSLVELLRLLTKLDPFLLQVGSEELLVLLNLTILLGK